MTCLFTLPGCMTYTHERLLHEGKIESVTVDSGYFQHKVFRAAAPIPAPENSSDSLYVYLGGDGRPWRTTRQVAKDPTSERSLMLKNMLQGGPKSVYIGRPCYYQVADARCQGSWWTYNRYHPDVVNSLLKVVEQLAENHQNLWLIGYSGGGTLAVLIGHRLNRPVNVMTVNANLDHQAWTEHHQYSPLTGSLNPIDDLAFNPGMQELHWYATEDQNILPAWTLAYCQKVHVQCLPITGSHSDGWPELWPAILRDSQDFFAPLKATAQDFETATEPEL